MTQSMEVRAFPEWSGLKLLVPTAMAGVSIDYILRMTNGCGRAGLGGRLVPDTIWGLDVSPACRVHDWMYQDAASRADEDFADAILAANLVSLIQQRTSGRLLTWLRLRRAYKYVDAVAMTDVLDVATLLRSATEATC